MPIPWTQDLSVNVKEIDAQHRHFLELLNKTYDVFKGKLDKTELEKMLKELLDYTWMHFQTEEKYFDDFGYELAEKHKAEHRKLEAQVNEFNQRIGIEGIEIVGELMDFLENWLVFHLEAHDRKYTKCFNEHGLN